jgi:hypothetical protein
MRAVVDGAADTWAALVLDHPHTMRTSKALVASGWTGSIIVPNRDVSAQEATVLSTPNVTVVAASAGDYLKGLTGAELLFKFMYLDYCGIFKSFKADLPWALKKLDVSGPGAVFACTYTKVHGGVPPSVARAHIEAQADVIRLHPQFVACEDYGTMYTLIWVMRPTYKVWPRDA